MPLEVRGTEVRLEEDTSPAAEVVGGTALAGGPQAGERTLQFIATDLESGVERIEAVIGDTVVASRDLRTRCPHVGFAACPESDSGVLTFDTGTVPNGSHRLALRVTDAAGNAQIVPAAAATEIANPSRPTPSVPDPSIEDPFPADGLARLTARFTSSVRSSLIVPYGRAVAMRGRLSRASEQPLKGARIDVVQRSAAAGGREVVVGSARTRADGTFSYRLSARGPSRSIRFVYGATASQTLRLKVRAASRFQVSLRGTDLRFSGRVISGPIPANGKRVLLRGRARATGGRSSRRCAPIDRDGSPGATACAPAGPGCGLQSRSSSRPSRAIRTSATAAACGR